MPDFLLPQADQQLQPPTGGRVFGIVTEQGHKPGAAPTWPGGVTLPGTWPGTFVPGRVDIGGFETGAGGVIGGLGVATGGGVSPGVATGGIVVPPVTCACAETARPSASENNSELTNIRLFMMPPSL
jgi:hypothetical protein